MNEGRPLVDERASAPADSDASNAKAVLRRCLQDETQPLLDTIRLYVLRFGPAPHDDVSAVAQDILQEVSLEALEHADRFKAGRRPLPWLLGIALNLVRRKHVERAKQARREWSAGAYAALAEGPETEADPFGETMASLAPDQLAGIEAEDEAEHLLTLVSPSDREVLRLAIIEGWDHAELARRLGTTTGAARVRLHRAIGRLRVAWSASDGTEPT